MMADWESYKLVSFNLMKHALTHCKPMGEIVVIFQIFDNRVLETEVCYTA